MGVSYAEVIGDPIAHSKSPLIHSFWFGKLNLEREYRPIRVTLEELPTYLENRRSDPEWRGCNVTRPHKQVARATVEHLEALAERSGAVNTIIPYFKSSLKGINTDAIAVSELLRRVRGVGTANTATYVQIIGAGGAARAAVIGALDAGFQDFDFFNRTVDKAKDLARWLSLPPDAYAAPLEALGSSRVEDEDPADQRYSHVIVNASVLGMEGEPEVPVDLTGYYPDTVVLDMAYRRGETKLVRQARQLGLRTIDGFDMLIEQAARAFPNFFEAAAPREHDAELRELLTS